MSENGRKGEKLAPFNPTTAEAIEAALKLLNIDRNDTVFELGCGDARFLIAAVQAGAAQGVGVEYDKTFVDRARQRVKDSAVEDRIRIMHENVLDVDIASASVIFVYLVPKGIKLIKPLLTDALARGARIVTYIFSIPGLEPKAVHIVKGVKVYLYDHENQPKHRSDECVSNNNFVIAASVVCVIVLGVMLAFKSKAQTR